MKEFQIHEPQSAQEASGLLAQFGWDASLYAGGTELLILMREGLAHFPHLIDVKHITGLNGVRLDDDSRMIRIGAAATHHMVERSDLVAQFAPLLAEVERLVGNIRVRVAGTIGGNLCFAEPRSDIATLFTAWPGVIYELTSVRGVRHIPAHEFNIDLFLTVREEDELMTAIILPPLPSGMYGAFDKFVTLERPTANVAAFLSLNNGHITSSSISVGSVGPAPYLATEGMALLEGQAVSDALFEAAADAVAEMADPVEDIYGAVDYKRQLVRVLTKRALKKAVEKAKGAKE